jgi:AbrB family looped-hinge helix DNA binding protein
MVLSNGMKDVLIPMDQAGRVVLPKAVRQELALEPGDVLKVSIRGAAVTLTPNKEVTGLVRKGKALVFSTAGEAILSAGTVEELLEAERDEHRSRTAGTLAGARRRT